MRGKREIKDEFEEMLDGKRRWDEQLWNLEKTLEGRYDKPQMTEAEKEQLELLKSNFKLKPLQLQIALELNSFLNEALPNTENPLIRLRLYRQDAELRKQFVIRCVQKGLIKL